MLADRKKLVERIVNFNKRSRMLVSAYSDFLATHFSIGDWFVTITLRDRHKDLELDARLPGQPRKHPMGKRFKYFKDSKQGFVFCAPDPRLHAWQPSSKNRREPGPPVRDAALREIEHWLLELGWEAAGRRRQEIFDWLADGTAGERRKELARKLSGNCLCRALLANEKFVNRFRELKSIATSSIGWVIAEEFCRLGGRWHVHLLIKGVTHLRRKRWWKKAFVRFGRTRIEPIHE